MSLYLGVEAALVCTKEESWAPIMPWLCPGRSVPGSEWHGDRAPVSISLHGERTTMAASSTLVTPTAHLSSSSRWGIAELLAALLHFSFMSLLWAHRIFVIVQSMSPVHPNQLKLISLKAGLLQVHLEVMYSKALFFLFP